METRAVSAKGLLDDLDYCIDARRDFNQDSHIMRTEAAAASKAGLDEGPSSEFGHAWWRRTFSNLYLTFDRNWGDQITQSGGDVSKGFLTWWNDYGLTQYGGPEGLKASMEKSFERIFLEERAKVDSELAEELRRRQQELSNTCKEDVGSQIVRFSETVVAKVIEGAKAPGEIVVGNFEGAKRESGIGAKVLRITTGISIKDAWNNPLGGENSEANKVKDAVDDFIKKPLGGDNSVFNNPCGSLC
ncbi:hypothetical protein [Paracoccus marinaquae]|uniref:Uncharacterized protein n=1 Tax=Paracoccus marinaquae TaxID=2841926 RepID=A0ABS6AHR1_9RHOB|nr:hypothetical protein [Paracoccus marinaquae]MBU3029726.1 hypothetical protein [Paracoccus marinaquae]